jgi:hypothetical protein
MKRITVVLALALLTLSACAQTKMVVGNTITVTWDAPALGTIPPAEISYEVVVQPRPSGTVTLVGTATMIEQVVAFTVEGPYRIGVRTKRTTPDATILYSAYFWADVDGTTPWYAVYYATPPKVERVRIK